jgi:hypothetical protein
MRQTSLYKSPRITLLSYLVSHLEYSLLNPCFSTDSMLPNLLTNFGMVKSTEGRRGHHTKRCDQHTAHHLIIFLVNRGRVDTIEKSTS